MNPYIITLIKSLVIISFLVALLFLIQAIRYGNKSLKNAELAYYHKKYRNWFAVATLIAVLLVEGMVRLYPLLHLQPSQTNKTLFYFHLICCVAPFAVIVILLFTKKLSPKNVHRAHYAWGYACAFFYVATFITGSILLYQY